LLCGSLADWNQVNNNGDTIAAGSVKLHGGGTVDGVTVTVLNARSHYNDPGPENWLEDGGTDPYFIHAVDDLMYALTADGPIAVRFGGLDTSLDYNVRVYALENTGGQPPINISVTDGAGTITRSGLDRVDLYNSLASLHPDLIVSAVSPDGSGNIDVSIDDLPATSSGYSMEAIVIEAIAAEEPAAVPEPGTLALVTLGAIGLVIRRK
jgi:hypothetical protein